jgi:hypothetical protein
MEVAPNISTAASDARKKCPWKREWSARRSSHGIVTGGSRRPQQDTLTWGNSEVSHGKRPPQLSQF